LVGNDPVMSPFKSNGRSFNVNSKKLQKTSFSFEDRKN